MEKILFIVPEKYNTIGGLKLPIDNYLESLKDTYNVQLVEMSYHPKKSSFIDIDITGNYYAIIVYGLNQAYGTQKYLFRMSNAWKKTIALLIDSETFYAESMLKKNIDKGIKYAIKMALKYAVYYFKEKKCLMKYDKVLYVSKIDREYVCKHFSKSTADIRVIENGVKIQNKICKKVHDFNKLRLGFISSYTPAVITENLVPLVERLMPYVLKEYPNTELIVAGRGMETEINKYLSRFEYVKYLGSVKYIDEFYESIDITVPVTLKPSGILNKVLEAWMYAKTTIAYEYNYFSFGDAIKNVHFLAGNSIQEIGDIIKKIYKHKIDIDEIGQNARNLILANYSWERKKIDFLRFVND